MNEHELVKQIETNAIRCARNPQFEEGYSAAQRVEYMRHLLLTEKLRAHPIVSVHITPNAIPSSEKIRCIKFIREHCITKPGLKEAKDLTEQGGYIHVVCSREELPTCLRSSS